MGRKGLRVLAVAKASVKSGVLTDTPHGYRFTILGLVGLADPLRENVKESVMQCSAAGIRVIMITGDYPATARAIARAAGIDASEMVSGCGSSNSMPRPFEPELGRALSLRGSRPEINCASFKPCKPMARSPR